MSLYSGGDRDEQRSEPDSGIEQAAASELRVSDDRRPCPTEASQSHGQIHRHKRQARQMVDTRLGGQDVDKKAATQRWRRLMVVV